MRRRQRAKRGDCVRGIVKIEDPQPLDGATLVVSLHDVTYLDAPSHILAERAYPVSGIPAQLPFCLPLPQGLSAAASYSVKAAIHRSDAKILRRGDYLSTASHPWSPGQTAAVVVVRRI